MKPIAPFLGWIVFLVAEYHITTVSSAPTVTSGLVKFRNGLNVMAGSQTRDKTDVTERKLIKSPNIFEKPEKKSQLKKKTTVSVNGHLLPIAGLSATDKTVHVTVQNSNQPARQTQLNGQAPLQAVVQEVVPGTSNTLLNPASSQAPSQTVGQGQVGMAPPTFPLQGVTNSQPNPAGQVGMAPPNLPAQGLTNLQPNTGGQVGMAPPSVPAQLSNSQLNSVDQGSLGMAPPRIPAQGLSNSQLNSGEQGPLGMAPPSLPVAGQGLSNSQLSAGTQGLQGLTQTQVPAQGLSNTLPNSLQGQGTIITPQTAAQVQGACNPLADSLQSGNKKPVHLGTNSDGQLTYKPIGC